MPSLVPERDPRIAWRSAADIRARFLDYFAERGHAIVPSSSLVPAGDDTLLFVNSGMVPFKDALTGVEKRSYTRAVNFQRCLRVAGKHNDFEEVGRSTRHQTFFEMLGNWSFGDYFKREAIHWGWEFLTKDLGIPGERLAATVYTTDDFAHAVWKDEIGLPPERLVRWGDFPNGDEKNWWRMADTGPCGPCSEIHYDRGAQYSEGDFCVPDHSENCPRWLEIWNLVFMEFELHPDRSLTPLPAPGIDTGMGLERVTSVVQQVGSNYDTDLFTAIHERMRELFGHDPDSFEAERFSYQVIADHSRAITFLLADGVLPSNEGRGYVCRRIVRRAVRHGRLLGRKEPFLAEAAKVVIATMGDFYGHLRENEAAILGGITREEVQFARTLDAGTDLLEEALIPLTSNDRRVGLKADDLPADAPELPGTVAFRLHDTFGFPIDLTVELAAEYGVRVDREGFDSALAEQRERSRSGTKAGKSRAVEQAAMYESLRGRVGDTAFLGYDTTTAEARVVAILRDGIEYQDLEAKGDEELRTEAGAVAEIVLDRTPFYPEGGGQIGDRGTLHLGGDAGDGGSPAFEVADTQRVAGTQAGGLIVHRGTLRGKLAIGDTVRAVVDPERRAATMRNHTGTHLLHRALRNVVSERAKQAGSLVAPEYLRFDFPFDRALTDDEKRAIEDEVRRIVRDDRPVTVELLPMATAIERGADAFFDEKYGETVRTIRVQDYSFELCGGTHCRASGQIGSFVITGERSTGSGVRRIEALTGANADSHLRGRLDVLDRAADAVGATTIEAVPDRIAALQGELREARRKLKEGGGSSGLPKPGDLRDTVQSFDGVSLVTLAAPFGTADAMKAYAKDLRSALGANVIAVALDGDEPQLFVTADETAIGMGVSAGELVKVAVGAIDGKGGGRPEMAQGRGTKREGVAAALDAVQVATREAVSRRA
ncbi:MAG: alanine--tRNA ligase [Chloroflexi bacterium]|nr:alanine--tRNA ligase [Chloroflexota bacterium]